MLTQKQVSNLITQYKKHQKERKKQHVLKSKPLINMNLLVQQTLTKVLHHNLALHHNVALVIIQRKEVATQQILVIKVNYETTFKSRNKNRNGLENRIKSISDSKKGSMKKLQETINCRTQKIHLLNHFRKERPSVKILGVRPI